MKFRTLVLVLPEWTRIRLRLTGALFRGVWFLLICALNLVASIDDGIVRKCGTESCLLSNYSVFVGILKQKI